MCLICFGENFISSAQHDPPPFLDESGDCPIHVEASGTILIEYLKFLESLDTISFRM